MRRYVTVSVVLLFFVLTGLPGWAEPPEDSEKPPTKEQMVKVRERIETLRIWKLTRALELDERTSTQLFPLLNRYDRKRAEVEQALWSDMRELKEALRERREIRLKEIIGRIEKDQKSLQGVNDEERTEVKKVLTTEQQAKFILFQHEFSREIRKIIDEARERRTQKSSKEIMEKALTPAK